MALSGHKVHFEFPETDAQPSFQLCQVLGGRLWGSDTEVTKGLIRKT